MYEAVWPKKKGKIKVAVSNLRRHLSHLEKRVQVQHLRAELALDLVVSYQGESRKDKNPKDPREGAAGERLKEMLDKLLMHEDEDLRRSTLHVRYMLWLMGDCAPQLEMMLNRIRY